MSGKIEISRELGDFLAEHVAMSCTSEALPWLKILNDLLATPVVERQPVSVSDEKLQSLADEAFRKWEKTGNPVNGVTGYMAAKAGFREGAAWAACAELSLDKVKELNQ